MRAAVKSRLGPMTRVSKPMIRGAVAAAFAFAGLAQAHEGHEHKLMGVVAAVDASHVEVKGSDGGTQSILIAPSTQFRKANQPASASDLVPNGKVVVKYREANGQKTATEVTVPATTK